MKSKYDKWVDRILRHSNLERNGAAVFFFMYAGSFSAIFGTVFAVVYGASGGN